MFYYFNRKGFWGLVLMLGVFPVFAQTVDTVKYPHGDIARLITTEGNQKTVREFRSGGRLESVSPYKDGQLDGKRTIYYSNGKVEEIAHYENGLRSGSFKNYWAEEKLRSKLNYKVFTVNGERQSLLHGEAKYYTREGFLQNEATYEKGLKSGTWKEYDRYGKLHEEKEYKEDKVHGEWLTYHPNGKLKFKQNYYAEMRVGDVLYQNVTHGKQVEFYQNGQKKSEREMEWGRPVGTWSEYHPNGQLRYRAEFSADGQTRQSVSYDEQGRKTGEGTQKLLKQENRADRWEEDGKVTAWRNGNLQSVAHYRMGKRHGLSKAYYDDGTLERSGEFQDGEQIGTHQLFWPDGSPRTTETNVEITYESGRKAIVRDGWHRRWTEQGDLIAEAFYYKDRDPVYQASHDEATGKLILMRYPAIGWRLEFYPDGGLQKEQLKGYNYRFFINGAVNQIQLYGVEGQGTSTYTFVGDHQRVSRTGHSGLTYDAPIENIRDFFFNPSENSFYQNFNDGSFKIKYSNGQTRLAGKISGKLPQGDWVFYSPFGEVLAFSQYKNGLAHGLSYERKLNGDTLSKSQNHQGAALETYTYFNNEAALISRTDSSGKRYLTREYHENGQPKNRKNLRTGEYTSWYPNGQISEDGQMMDAQEKLFLKRSFYENGQLRGRVMEKAGKMEGEYRYYYEDGQPQLEAFYENGQLNGTFTAYLPDGKLRLKGKVVNDKKQGHWLLREDGELEEVYFENDKRVVAPPAAACDCIDTAVPVSRWNYVNFVKKLAKYDEIDWQLFPFLQPLDSTVYNQLAFVVGPSLEEHSGYFQLYSFGEVVLGLKSNSQSRLLLTPCHTKGFYSRMEFNYFLNPLRPEDYYVNVGSGKCAYQFQNPALSQENAVGWLSFRLEVDDVEFNVPDHIATQPELPEVCFETIATKAGKWRLDSGRAKPLLRQRPVDAVHGRGTYNEAPFDFGFLSEGPAKDTVNGMVFLEAAGGLTIKKRELPFTSNNLWLTDTWAGGEMVFEMGAENPEGYSLKDSEGKFHDFEKEELLENLQQNNFENLKLEVLEQQQKLRVLFFLPTSSQ